MRSRIKKYASGIDIYSQMKKQVLESFDFNADFSTEILENTYFKKLTESIIGYDGQIDDKVAAINLYLCALKIDEE